MAEVKGAAYVSTFDFIARRFGPDAKNRVLARLSAEDRELLGGLILAAGWYPVAPLPRLLRAMDQTLGSGDLALSTERGQWVAINDMKTTHKLLLKLVSPSWVIEKATLSLWKNFQRSGRWETLRQGNSGAQATLHDHALTDEAFCATLKGWMLGLLTLAGCKQISVEHPECRARRAKACVYQVTWA
jgi:hypothetical protein